MRHNNYHPGAHHRAVELHLGSMLESPKEILNLSVLRSHLFPMKPESLRVTPNYWCILKLPGCFQCAAKVDKYWLHGRERWVKKQLQHKAVCALIEKGTNLCGNPGEHVTPLIDKGHQRWHKRGDTSRVFEDQWQFARRAELGWTFQVEEGAYVQRLGSVKHS